ncbi:hypothetical protein ScPMuIL_014308 [Solemya velum]
MTDICGSSNSTSNECKINCRSRRSVRKYVLQTVEEGLDDMLANTSLSESDRQRYKGRFLEIYNGAFEQGILVDGREWTDCTESQDETTEYECIDQAKKRYINFDLVQMMDEAMVQLGERRRTCPQRLKSILSKILDAQLERLAREKVDSGNPIRTETTDDHQVSLENTQEILKSTLTKFSSLGKNIKETIEKARCFNTAAQIKKKCDECDTNGAVYKECENRTLLRRSPRRLKSKLFGIKWEPYSNTVRCSPTAVNTV